MDALAGDWSGVAPAPVAATHRQAAAMTVVGDPTVEGERPIPWRPVRPRPLLVVLRFASVVVAVALLILAVDAGAGLVRRDTGRNDALPGLTVDEGASVPASPGEVFTGLSGRVAARYVILVDTSQSMAESGRYDAALDALRKLVSGLAATDDIALIAFGEAARVVYSGPAGRTPAEVVDLLPANPGDSRTDIGQALDRAVSALASPPVAAVNAVVLLTDGGHEPAAGSPYPFSAGTAWTRLRDRAAAIPDVVAMGLPLAPGAVAGANLLETVFPGAVIAAPESTTTLTDRIEAEAVAVLARKAGMIAASVTVVWPDKLRLRPGAQTVEVTVDASASQVPVTLSNLALRTDCPDVTAALPTAALTLDPGQARPLAVEVRWNPSMDDRLTPVRLRCGVALDGTVGSPWSAVLAQSLDSPLKLDVRGARTEVTVAGVLGAPSVIGSAVTLALLALVGWWWWRRLPVLRGTLVVSTDGQHNRAAVPLRGRRTRVTLNDGPTSRQILARPAADGRRLVLSIDRTTRILDRHVPTRVSGVSVEWDATEGPATEDAPDTRP